MPSQHLFLLVLLQNRLDNEDLHILSDISKIIFVYILILKGNISEK